MKGLSFFLKSLFVLLPLTAFSEEVWVTDGKGECLLFDVEGTKSLSEISGEIASLCGEDVISSKMIVELGKPRELGTALFNFNASSHGGRLDQPRNYYAAIPQSDRNDIRYIIMTLSDKSLIAIAKARGDLNAAGDRIDPLHPLNFLKVVFTDEELKVGISHVRNRGSWIWSKFVGGLADCLKTEASINNVTDAMLVDFARTVKVDPNLLRPLAQNGKWEDFVNLLIAIVPREGGDLENPDE